MANKSFRPRKEAEIADFDFRMRRNVAQSLGYIYEALGGGAKSLADIDGLKASIAAHRQSPVVFARYFETVYALAGGRSDKAQALLGEIAALAGTPARFEVKALSTASMGAEAERYVRLLNAGEDKPIFAAAAPRHWDDFEGRVAAAFTLIEAASPALAAEIRALVAQVIGAEPRDSSAAFGSVSSLTLWGAVTINLEGHRSILDVAEALVHEGAHLLLFACALDEPLVENADAERFNSPLRPDLRPMDGIFHATFVCARLFMFFAALAARRPPELAAEDAATLPQRLAHVGARFDDGARTLAAEARMTPTGKAIFDSTLDFMTHARG